MILVSVGTHEQPFDRLLDAVDALGGSEEVVVQHGPSLVRPSGATCHSYLGFDELVVLVRAARRVVTHAGVGSITVSLREGKRPIVMPRLRAHGEHVDDHQVELTRRLADAGLVVCVTDAEQLRMELARSEPRVEDDVVAVGGFGGGVTPLAVELRHLLRGGLGLRPLPGAGR